MHTAMLMIPPVVIMEPYSQVRFSLSNVDIMPMRVA